MKLYNGQDATYCPEHIEKGPLTGKAQLEFRFHRVHIKIGQLQTDGKVESIQMSCLKFHLSGHWIPV